MRKLLVKNIATLVAENQPSLCRRGAEMAVLDTLADAWLYCEDGRVSDFGTSPCPAAYAEGEVVDAQGGTIMPSFCDSHTHLVYADSREDEFVDKIRGLSYAEIARRGGGILNSADRLHELSEDELYRQAMRRIDEFLQFVRRSKEVADGEEIRDMVAEGAVEWMLLDGHQLDRVVACVRDARQR